jgi:hypothetical protein
LGKTAAGKAVVSLLQMVLFNVVNEKKCVDEGGKVT